MLGLGLSIPQLATRGGRTLTLSQQVAALFASGAQGAWYDPSDLATLYEDSAGTTPITTPLEKPVGLMLDKSKGLVLGSELVTNGDFSNGSTGWSLWDGTVSGGTLNISSGSAFSQIAFQALPLTVGNRYKITLTVARTSGNFYVGLVGTYGLAISAGYNISSGGSFSLILAAQSGANGIYFIGGGAGANLSIDNISVRELPGNHATQSTTTSRPTLSARYNLLTKTEQFDDAAWSKSQTSVTANSETDPLGGNTADKIIPNTSSFAHQIDSADNIITTTATIRISIYAKAAGYSKIAISDAQGTGVYASFDLATASVLSSGTFGTGTASNPTITSVGSSWYRLSVDATPASSKAMRWTVFVLSPSYTTGSPAIAWAGNGTSGIYIWGADLRVANDGIGLPAYQRVNTATDYDYAGFPAYVRFDGIDDSMVTGNIDFTATDKMSVFAGVRKLSDAATAMLVELSNSTAIVSNTGALHLATAYDNSANYNHALRGSSDRSQITLNNFPAPVSNVISVKYDISGASATDEIISRVNGSSPSQTVVMVGPAGSGNFGNYPFYIGARGGATLPFNGRLYSLVVCGKLASASEITSTESYINNKTKAY